MIKLCDWVSDFGTPAASHCDQEAQFAVKIGTTVGRYCGAHLYHYLDTIGVPTIVFPVETADEVVLSYEPEKITR